MNHSYDRRQASTHFKLNPPFKDRWTSVKITKGGSPNKPVWSIVLQDDPPVPDYTDVGFTHSEWLSSDAQQRQWWSILSDEEVVKGILSVLRKGRFLPEGFEHVGGANPNSKRR